MTGLPADPRVPALLGDLASLGSHNAEVVAAFCSRVTRPLDRVHGSAHVTASCVVFSPDLTQILLTHHAKGGFWVQFGGHIEPTDQSVRAAAQREVREESGLNDLGDFTHTPIDVHTHDLPGQFGHCRTHHDIVYAALADPAQPTHVSAESNDVRWFACTDLPAGIVADLPVRLPTLIFQTQKQFRG